MSAPAFDDRPYVGPRHRWRTGWLAGLLAEALAERTTAGRPNQAGAREPSQLVLLDLGCGDGTVALDLAARGFPVLACDLDVGRLRRLAERAREHGLTSRIHVFRADAQTLPLAAGCLSGAACGEVLEHLARDGDALTALRASLTPGAPLVLSVPTGPRRLGTVDRAIGHHRRYDEAGLRSLLAGAGFDITLLRSWGFPFGRLYDRWVQGPALMDSAPARRRLWSRLGRSALVDRFFRLLFNLDLPLSRLAPESGSGWMASARSGLQRPSSNA